MNKKALIIAVAAGLGIALYAGTASADDGLPPPPEPEPLPPGPDPLPPGPPPQPRPNDPPNISGDAAGYNTVRFNGVQAVRQWFVNMGYSVIVFTDTPLIKNRKVKRFQRDYNKVASRPGKSDMGMLTVDGTAGKNTLNALEIAWMQTQNFGKSWNMIVKGA